MAKRHCANIEWGMDMALALLGILGALAVGVVSPGPSFVLIARISAALSRRDGLAASLGMGAGGVAFCTLALVGLHALLARIGWLYLGIKVAGGLYLVYLAFGLWRGAARPLEVPAGAAGGAGLWASFLLGLGTQLSNPKTAVVYGSIFAALLPPEVPAWMFATLPPLVFVLEAGWYSAVALAFSTGHPRNAYLRSKAWIDRAAGTLMGALGLKLVAESAQPG